MGLAGLPLPALALAPVVALRSGRSRALFALLTPDLWAQPQELQRDAWVFLDPSKDPLGGVPPAAEQVGIGSAVLLRERGPDAWPNSPSFSSSRNSTRLHLSDATGEEKPAMGPPFAGWWSVSIALMGGPAADRRQRPRTDFESLVVVGLGAMVSSSGESIIFMTIGRPVTGIPCPDDVMAGSRCWSTSSPSGLRLGVLRRSRSARGAV